MVNLCDLATQALIASRLKRAEAKVNAVSKEAGPVGETGPAGATGADGKKGDKGETGPQGERGERGEIGPKGDTGPRGQRGELGLRGYKGDTGAVGASGADGKKGDKGDTGPQGETGPAPDHEWQGTKLRFKKPNGKWGKAVDLKGKDGEDAGTVVISRGGSSDGAGLESLLPGAGGTEPAGIAVVQNGQWVNLPWAAFIQTIAGAVDMGVELSRRSDFVGSTIIYRGEATPGASESASVWRIKRIEFAPDGDVTEKWAGGNANFVNAWDDRATLSYI